ncbi:MAG: Calx-beta domain-containing protein, partial [Bacteroidota bacterium]|nr:Calx-beta domain-containing protein [Bacteroidota bacterium]
MNSQNIINLSFSESRNTIQSQMNDNKIFHRKAISSLQDKIKINKEIKSINPLNPFFMKSEFLLRLKNLWILPMLFLLLMAMSMVGMAQTVTIFTDQDDYWPGEWVVITGDGWTGEDSVKISLEHIEPNIPSHTHDPWHLKPDVNGRIYDEWFVEDQELGTTFHLMALGIPSGRFAENWFTDAADGIWDGDATNDNWSTALNWSNDKVPVATDAIVIPNGFNVIVDSPNAVGASLVLGNGNGIATLTFSGTNPKLIITGTVNIGKTTSGNNVGVMTFTSGSTLEAGSVSLNKQLNGTTKSEINMNAGGLLKTGSLAIFGGGGATDLIWTPGTGTVEMTANNTLPTTIFTNFNNLTINGGTTTLGAARIITGNLTISSGTLIAGAFTHNVARNFTNNGTFTAGTSTINFNGNNTLQNISGSSTTGFNNIIVNKGTSNSNVLDVQSPVTMASGGLTITNGTFKLSSASTIAPFSGARTIGSTAGFHLNNASATSNWGSAGTLTVQGLLKIESGTLNVGVNTGNSLLIDGAASNVQVSGGLLNIAGRWQQQNGSNSNTANISGGIINVSTAGRTSNGTVATFQVPAANNLSMDGGTIRIYNANDAAGGDLKITNASASISGGTLTIGNAGSTLGNIQIQSTPALYNVTINAGSTTPVLATNVTVNGDLALTGGIITTGANVLTIGSGGSFSGGSATSHVSGKLARAYSSVGSKGFPIGKGGNYRPLNLEYTALSGTSTVTAEQLESSISGTLPDYTTLFAGRQWNLTQTGGSGYTYNITLDGTGFTPGASDPVILKDGATPLNSYQTTVSGSNYTATGLTSMSNFALASSCAPPTISDQPDAATKCVGGSVSFSVTASGPGTITYSWRKNGVAIVPAETGSSYTISSVVSANAGSYDVVITRLCGSSVTSDAAVLTVNPVPTLSIDDVTVNEGAGTATFTATLSAPVVCDVTFDVATTDNSAIAGSDYTALVTTLYTIEAWNTSKTITVPILNDNVLEGDEIFFVNLANPNNATIADGEGVGTIADNDASEVSIVATTQADEEGPVDGLFTLSLSNPVSV